MEFGGLNERDLLSISLKNYIHEDWTEVDVKLWFSL